MANKNNNVEKVSALLLSTKKQELIIVTNNANAGLQYVVIQPVLLPNGEIDRVDWINASKLNIAQDVEPLVKAMYSKAKRPIPSAAGCPVLASYRAVLDEDQSIALFSEKLPCEVLKYTDKDVNGVTVKDYVLNVFGYPDSNGDLTVGFELKDIDIYNLKVTVPEYKVDEHDPISKLSANEINVYVHRQDKDLYDSIEITKPCRQVDNFLRFDNPVNPHKNIMLFGGKGVGKSTLAEHIADKYNMPIVSITGDPSLTIEDLCGYVIPNNGSTGSTTPWITQESDFLRAYTSGWVIKIDEVNNFSNSVLIGLNDAFYGKHRAIKYQGKTIPCHPKTVIICTTNFGYQGNNPMNEAFVDRFYPILMTDLVEDNYAAYLSKKNPSLDAVAIKEYTKFMFKLMSYMEQTFENQDRFNPNTPAISVRRFSEVLMTSLASKSFKQVLGDVIYAIIHGVEDNKTKTQAVLAHFDKDITTIEQLFFMDKQIIKDAKKAMASVLSIGVAASTVNTNSSSTNVDDIFNKANSGDSSSASSIIDGLDNLQW